jgi:misacylated tRNA(Ala) deacylase
MTTLLYETDSYVRDFRAHVMAIDGRRVMLDRSAFFPTGGGQPSDKGALIHDGVVRAVTDVKRLSGEIWHSYLGPPLPEGKEVMGHIDWQRRFALMRTHTALHILSAVVWRDYGRQVTGGDMKPLAGRLDFEFESLDIDIANAIEKSVNEEVAAARAIKVSLMPREEAFRIPDLIRTKINLLPSGMEIVRVVEIVGLDTQADSGTHVANTREVGRIGLIGIENKGRKNKRLRIELQPSEAVVRELSS